MRWVVVGWLVMGCGRIGFDASGTADDGGNGDSNSDTPQQVVLDCASLPAVCGAAGDESCCESLTVPGGSYFRHYDVGSDGAFQSMAFPATVSTFRLDEFEVTVGRFRQFIEAGLGTQQRPPAAGAGARTFDGVPGLGGWDPTWNAMLPADTAALVARTKCVGTTFTDLPGADDAKPQNCIDFFVAMAFCIADGGFIPTALQWRYAAAGGDEQRAYPWSNPPSSVLLDSTHATFNSMGPIIAVGTKPLGVGRWGHHDFGGNLGEWLFDAGMEDPVPCDDCASLTESGFRQLGGGSWLSGSVRPAGQAWNTSTRFANGGGVRCARP